MTEHAIERIEERYNKDFTMRHMWFMANEIRRGNSIFIRNASDGCSFHYVMLNNIPVKVLYSPRSLDKKKNKFHKKPTIVTVYELDVDEYNAVKQSHDERLKKIDIAHVIKIMKNQGYRIFNKNGDEL